MAAGRTTLFWKITGEGVAEGITQPIRIVAIEFVVPAATADGNAKAFDLRVNGESPGLTVSLKPASGIESRYWMNLPSCGVHSGVLAGQLTYAEDLQTGCYINIFAG